MKNKIKLIVPGGLNTDIVGIGVPKIVGKGELAMGGVCKIGPGGKSRNIASMASLLLGENEVAMIGKTSKDEFGLWKKPVESLEKNGVNTDFIKILDFEETGKMPGIALIPVDKDGNNQIYSIPGINEDFCEKDIDDAEEIFEIAGNNGGAVAYSLEMPFKTVLHSMDKAKKFGLKNIFDPGGMEENFDYSELFEREIFLIKPNEHEAKMFTEIEIKDFESAEKSAKIFFEKGVKNVLITAGINGAYFFSEKTKKHFKIPEVEDSEFHDETGCGDQTMATLCAFLSKGYNIEKAIEIAILSGTLQFHKAGIGEIKISDIEKYFEV
ncbi:PfkB family carbohydrate kinase [Candidatus Gracilibacteria bacterium]|nr:PfkB family carbohydrate kinase [Candidatus Gracilibacteria bacterium]